MAVVEIDIENSAGTKLGSGPIVSASRWRYTARMDKAGIFEFDMPASDPKASVVEKKRIARAYAWMAGQRVEVGAGIIDRIQRVPQVDGTVMLRVSGDDLARELTYRSVLNLKLYSGGNPVTHSAALTAVGAYAPAGWTFTPDASPPNDSVYGYFNGETVLAGMGKIAQKSQNHWYRGAGRTLVFASSFSDSGVRAIQAKGDLATNTCAISQLTEQVDTYDLINRIYPRGSGNGDVQLTLRATGRTAPTGYVLNAAQNYIEHTASIATYGRIERQVDFRDIGPVENTDADIVAASNMLFDAAIEELRRRSTELEQATYMLQIAGCRQLLRPMQSLRVVYRDATAGLNINAALNILEATWQVDAAGVYTTDLVVSNADRWPKSDVGTIVDGLEQGQVYQALPQLNANSYVTAYGKNVDIDHTAAFRFRFGAEVVQLQQVLFEFQLLEFESTVRSVAGTTTTSSSGGGSVASASSGGSHTHSVTVPAHSHTVTVAAHSHTVTVAAHSHTVTVAAHSHTVTVAAHSHTVTVAAHTHTVTVVGHAHTVTVSNHTHTVAISSHSHDIEIYDTPSPGSPSMKALMLDISNEILAVAVSGTGNVEYLPTTDVGGGSTETSSSGGGQSVTSSSLSDTTPTSSTAAQTTPTSSTVAQSTPTSSELAQSTPTSSLLAQATPTSSELAQSTPTSNLLAQAVQTSSADGTHTHAVTIPAHTHTLTPVIETMYGIYRAQSVYTYDVADLEYRINGGAWASLSLATSVGSGWYQLDITSAVQDSTTYRPLQESNLLEIRAPSLTILEWFGDLLYMFVETSAAHGLSIGDEVQIAGAAVGTLDINRVWEVNVVVTANSVFLTTGVASANDSGFDGIMGAPKTATIDAQLSVRNIIQAVAYV